MPLLPPTTLDPDLNWYIEDGFNEAVDFCVWVLEQSGLQVYPFDQHSPFDSAAQAAGLTPFTWQRWFTTVVLLQDPVLAWNLDRLSCAEWIEHQLVPMQRMTDQLKSSPDWAEWVVDWDTMRQTLVRHYEQHTTRQRSIAALLPAALASVRPYRDAPVAVWDAIALNPNAVLQHQLAEWWRQYDTDLWQTRMDTAKAASDRLAVATPAQTHIMGATRLLRDALPYLNLYRISYESMTEVCVPPYSVVLSNPNLDTAAIEFEDFIDWAVQNLSLAETQIQRTDRC